MLIVGAAVWGVMSRRSRFAAVVLLGLSGLNFVGALGSLGELEGTTRFAVVLTSATAVFLSVQALRAVRAYRRFAA